MSDALLSIAPMIDWTYSHFRVFMRLLAPRAMVYTEMQSVGAILHNPKRALNFHPIEHPVAIQLGGSDIRNLVACAIEAEQAGYDEINLNLGCPSNKVQSGHFGACLMREADHVSQCIYAMKQSVRIPVTAKTRIGIDDQDSYEFFSQFARMLVDSGCDKLIVHARKAWLHGLSPKQNRTIPPVQYDYVYRIKKEIPHIPVVLNGNVMSIQEVQEHLSHVDGVMLGRLACQQPYAISEIHAALYPEYQILNRREILLQYLDYLIPAHAQGAALSLLIKPLFNLASATPYAGAWRKKLNEVLHHQDVSLFNALITITPSQ